jgi:hypothetical protein
VSAIAEQLYSSQFFDLFAFASEEFPILDAGHALTRLLVALKQCAATTDLGFRRWSHAFIRTMADDIARDQVTSFEEVIKIAQERDTEPKPPFIAEQNPTRPEITFVKIERGQGGSDSSVWIVPTDKLPLVQILHPTVAVRFMRIGNRRDPYLVKRCQRQLYSGAWDTVERDLGAIWLGIDEQFKSYESKDGNYLNYASGNLRPYQLPYRDAFNSAYFGLLSEDGNARSEDWVPDKATPRPKIQGEANPDDADYATDLEREMRNSASDESVTQFLEGHGPDYEGHTPKFKERAEHEAAVASIIEKPARKPASAQPDADLAEAVQKLRNKWRACD